eukprot:7809630-Heterocapsa_arctica.AAC.1
MSRMSRVAKSSPTNSMHLSAMSTWLESMECRVVLHTQLIQGLPRKAAGDPMLVATQDGAQVKVGDVLVH